ncbi:hypothetical protein [Aestuariivirga litoralis]|uniref:hypothetical protein n=1 Tax=Aestuariivirga litoralis TaxID=2650924 RepID=UPI0018C500EF|nr:hypothetical protein [Aestuariivirga litoralis]MBG1233981.1 hypothetical protein [Aestuariivirga litoralis]
MTQDPSLYRSLHAHTLEMIQRGHSLLEDLAKVPTTPSRAALAASTVKHIEALEEEAKDLKTKGWPQ